MRRFHKKWKKNPGKDSHVGKPITVEDLIKFAIVMSGRKEELEGIDDKLKDPMTFLRLRSKWCGERSYKSMWARRALVQNGEHVTEDTNDPS